MTTPTDGLKKLVEARAKAGPFLELHQGTLIARDASGADWYDLTQEDLKFFICAMNWTVTEAPKLLAEIAAMRSCVRDLNRLRSMDDQQASTEGSEILEKHAATIAAAGEGT